MFQYCTQFKKRSIAQHIIQYSKTKLSGSIQTTEDPLRHRSLMHLEDAVYSWAPRELLSPGRCSAPWAAGCEPEPWSDSGPAAPGWMWFRPCSADTPSGAQGTSCTAHCSAGPRGTPATGEPSNAGSDRSPPTPSAGPEVQRGGLRERRGERDRGMRQGRRDRLHSDSQFLYWFIYELVDILIGVLIGWYTV